MLAYFEHGLVVLHTLAINLAHFQRGLIVIERETLAHLQRGFVVVGA